MKTLFPVQAVAGAEGTANFSLSAAELAVPEFLNVVDEEPTAGFGTTPSVSGADDVISRQRVVFVELLLILVGC